jgi:alanine-synthesizing transaminase
MKMPDINADRMHRLPPYLFGRINKVKQEMRHAGRDVIDLGMGNPSDPTPQIIVDKLCEAVRDPRNHRYSDAAGLKNLRREFAKFYKHFWNVDLDADTEVIATIGSKEGFSHLCLAMLGHGDTAIVPTPAFPIHVYGPVLAGANVVGVPMHGSLEQTLGEMEHILRNHFPRPKAMILNFPHNPTARVVDLGFFEKVVEIAKKYGVWVIQDFAYGLTVFDGYRAPSILQVAGASDVAVELTTMSKAYNMAGWRVGFCAGNKDIIKALSTVKAYYDYGVFQAVQVATIIALRKCEADIWKQAEMYQRRRDVLCEGLQRLGWTLERPKATMFVWARYPEEFQKMGSADLAMKLLEEAEVAVAPGAGFGDEGEGWLRLAIVENENRLRQAVRQIGLCLKGKPLAQKPKPPSHVSARHKAAIGQ